MVYKLFDDTHELYAPSFLCSLFDKLFQPVLLYGSKVWGFQSALDVERLHLSFCKTVYMSDVVVLLIILYMKSWGGSHYK